MTDPKPPCSYVPIEGDEPNCPHFAGAPSGLVERFTVEEEDGQQWCVLHAPWDITVSEDDQIVAIRKFQRHKTCRFDDIKLRSDFVLDANHAVAKDFSFARAEIRGLLRITVASPEMSIDLTDANIHGPVHISKSRDGYLSGLVLEGTRWDGDITIEPAVHSDINFSGDEELSGNVSFSGNVRGTIAARGRTFTGRLKLPERSGGLDLSNVKIGSTQLHLTLPRHDEDSQAIQVVLDGAEVHCHIEASPADLSATGAYLKHLTLTGEGSADLTKSTIGGIYGADISHTMSTFKGSLIRSADFSRSSFQYTSFSDVCFGRANFGDCRLVNTSFARARFDGADFHVASSEVGTYNLDFSNATFRGDATFEGRRFTGTTSFDEASFSIAPNFSGCKLSDRTSLHGIRLRDHKSKDAHTAYRKLRHLAEEIRDREAEGIFYRAEQVSRRRPSNSMPFLPRILSYLYGCVSDYGLSLVRPIVTLIVTYGLTWWALVWRYTRQLPPGVSPTTDEREDLAAFSAEQIARPFSAWGTRYRTNFAEDHPARVLLERDFLATISLVTLETIAGLTLVGLFILAVRWRFRRA